MDVLPSVSIGRAEPLFSGPDHTMPCGERRGEDAAAICAGVEEDSVRGECADVIWKRVGSIHEQPVRAAVCEVDPRSNRGEQAISHRSQCIDVRCREERSAPRCSSLYEDSSIGSCINLGAGDRDVLNWPDCVKRGIALPRHAAIVRLYGAGSCSNYYYSWGSRDVDDVSARQRL